MGHGPGDGPRVRRPRHRGRRLRRGRYDPRVDRPTPQRPGHRHSTTASRWWRPPIPPTCSPWTTCARSSAATSSSWSPPGPRSAPTSSKAFNRAATPPTWPWRPSLGIDGPGRTRLDDIQAVTEKRPSSATSTSSSSRRSTSGPRTSTSSPRRRTSASATASTACSMTCRPPPRPSPPAVTTRLKVMADMNIAEHRVPQDGRISLNVGSQGHRPAHGHPSHHLRREGGHAGARQVERRAGLRRPGLRRRHARDLRGHLTPSPTGRSWSPGRPARASRPRSTPP